VAITTKKGKPITASRTAMQPRAPVLANQAETSRDLQQRLRGQATQPFTNKGGAATLPVPTNPAYRSTGNPKELNYQIKSIGCGNTSLSAEQMDAVGYSPNATKSDNPIISGHPSRGNVRQVGKPGSRNSDTSARENSRMRSGQ
jgi:hypothetical protein